GCARGAQRHPLPALDGVPMEGAAERLAAPEHGVGLPRPLGLGRDVDAHPPRALRRGAREGGARGLPDAGHHRQPERKGRAKRGSTLDASGCDAGKTVLGRKRHIL
ncbi:MAG: Mobile element protein, partial [uncultured Sphingomonas sp.]